MIVIIWGNDICSFTNNILAVNEIIAWVWGIVLMQLKLKVQIKLFYVY